MKKTCLSGLCLGTALALTYPSLAAPLNWNGGTGTWDNGLTSNWLLSGSPVPWSAGNTAVFGGSPANVTVSGTIPGVEGLTFNSSGYSLSGSGTLTLSGGTPTVFVGPGLFATNSALLGGSAGVTVTGGGTFRVTNTGHPITGPYVVNAGSKLIIPGNFIADHAVTANGTVDFSSALSGGRFIRDLTGNGVVTAASMSSGTMNLRLWGGDFSGNIENGGGATTALVFERDSSGVCGTLRLSGNNTYSGQTLLRYGSALRLDSPGALSPNTWLQLENATNILELAAYGNLHATYNLAAAGGLRFNFGSNPFFAAVGGERQVALDSFTWHDGSNLSQLGFGSANSTHKILWTSDIALAANSSAVRPILVLDGPMAVDAEVSGSISSTNASPILSKRGGGTLLLSGVNTHSGETRIEAGMLALGNDSAAGVGPIRFHLAGAGLTSADASARTLNNVIVVAESGIFGTPGSGDLIFNNSVETGSGAKFLTVSNNLTVLNADLTGGVTANPNIKRGPGTLALNSFTTSTKPFIIEEGTLALGAFGGMLTTNLLVNTNGILDVSAVSGGYSFGGSRTLSGSGTVVGAANVNSGAVIEPGTDVGTLTFSGDLTLQGALLDFDVNGTFEQGAFNDLIQVNGNLTLADFTTISLNPLGGTIENGTYKLIKYTGVLNGDANNLVKASSLEGTRQTASFQLLPGEINLVVSGTPADLQWNGTELNYVWDIATTPNWLRGASPDTFFNFDNVTFNNAGYPMVELQTAVSPNSVTVDTAGTYLFTGSGNLSGLASITKTGSGTLVIGNWLPNNNTGSLTINDGTVIIGNNNDGSGSIGSGDILNEGTLAFRNASEIVVPGAISGTGALVHEGIGNLVLAGNSDFTGQVLVNTNSRVLLQGSSGSTAASLGNSTNVTVKYDAELQVAVGGTFNEPLFIEGDGREFETTGALRTSATIDWSGPVTLSGDTVIGTESGVLTLSGGVTGGAFGLSKLGGGRLVLATNNTYGTTTISAGTLQVGADGTAGSLGTGAIVNEGVLVAQRSDDFTIANEISGSGQVQKYGAGTLSLTGNNSFTGRLMTALGTLAIGSDSATGTGLFRIGNGTGTTVRSADASTRTIGNEIEWATSATFGSPDSGNLVFSGYVNSGSAGKTFTISNAVTTFNGVIGGGTNSNSMIKAGPGTLVLNGANIYGKPTVVNEGTLLINGSITDKAVTVNGGVLGGNGSISGPVTVAEGGTLAPGGTPGILTINNSLVLQGNTRVDITLGSCDLITGLTSVTLGGTLTINNLPSGLTTANVFQLFNAASYAGAFTSIVPASPGPGLAWDTSTLHIDGTLRIMEGGVLEPTDITFGLTSEGLELSWPQSHQGWILQGQTNAPGIGLTGNWNEVPNSTSTNRVFLGVDPSAGSVFYRLISPEP